MEKENKKLGLEPAFASNASLSTEDIYQNGMSKRLYIATHIMSGLYSDPSFNKSIEESVHIAYKITDELLKQENE